MDKNTQLRNWQNESFQDSLLHIHGRAILRSIFFLCVCVCEIGREGSSWSTGARTLYVKVKLFLVLIKHDAMKTRQFRSPAVFHLGNELPVPIELDAGWATAVQTV
jgi:hypothetical protein